MAETTKSPGKGGTKPKPGAKGKPGGNGKVTDINAAKAAKEAADKAKAEEKATSIEDREKRGDGNEPESPEIEIAFNRQLGFNVGAGKKVKEAEIVVTQKRMALKGLLDPDAEGTILMRVKPMKYEQVPVRDSQGNTTHFKTVMQVRPVWAEKVEGADALLK